MKAVKKSFMFFRVTTVDTSCVFKNNSDLALDKIIEDNTLALGQRFGNTVKPRLSGR